MQDATHGLWAQTAMPTQPFPQLAGDLSVDVAVIGGGYGGLSSALQIAAAGGTVALLEANSIGFGGAGRNSGLVNAGMWVMPDDIAKDLGDGIGERLIRFLGEAPTVVFDIIRDFGIDCESERRGTLHCAVGAKGLAEIAERARQWHKRGVAVREIGAEETRERLGSTRYAGALEDPRAGTIQPLSYVRGLARAAQGKGARIFTDSAVSEVRRELGRWQLVTPKGRVTADWVIAAGESYSIGATQPIRETYVQLPFFNMATRPLQEDELASVLISRQAMIDTQKIISAFRLDQAGRLIIGSVGSLGAIARSVHAQWANRSIARAFPQLRGLKVEQVWGGVIGMTANHLPKLEWLGPQMIAVGGYNGRGIAPGTAMGTAVAKFVAGKIPEADLPLPITKPVARHMIALHETYIRQGAIAAHLVGNRFTGA